jgi:hypothetical protein
MLSSREVGGRREACWQLSERERRGARNERKKKRRAVQTSKGSCNSCAAEKRILCITRNQYKIHPRAQIFFFSSCQRTLRPEL